MARRVLMVNEACALPRAPASPGTRASRSKRLSSEAPGQRSGKMRSPIGSAALASVSGHAPGTVSSP
jgi:hypothetical protein